MKRISFLTVAIVLAQFCLAQNMGRIVENINFGWRFHAGDIEDAMLYDYDDSAWETINVPHDFQISQPWVAPKKDEKEDKSNLASYVKSRLSSRAFKDMGVGWYRLSLIPDDSWQGKRILLDFEGIMLTGDVFFNGELVGGTDYGYVGFEIDISKSIKFGEKNVIAVKADTRNPENSRWYTGGGLFRDVNVVVTDPQMYFTRHPLYITTPTISDQKANVMVQAEITCTIKTETFDVKTQIKDPQGEIVYEKNNNLKYNGKQKTKEYSVDSISIENPALWDCENPNLYTVTLTLFRPDGTIADSISENFGIRSIEYSPEFGFKLNGKKVLLKGIANHHSLGALGAAAYPRAIEKRIQLLKDYGFNHIRTSHNPYSKSFLDLCDRYGILVVDELYDKWTTQYAGGRIPWTQLWQHDVPEFIRRDRNHPCVVMWSLGNELQMMWDIPYADWGVTPYRLQRELLKRYDTTRPITVAMHPRGRSLETDSLPAPLALETDIASYNYRYMYFPGDGRRFPNMIFYQSEANLSDMGPNYFEMDLDKVVGLAYWGMIDYLGESPGWPSKGFVRGIFDIALEPKPVAYFLKSFFKPEEPVVHIGIIDGDDNTEWNGVKVGTQRMSDHWNRIKGSKLSLYTYTNAEEVELFINGKSLGTKHNSTDPKTRNKILWEDIEYMPGNILAVAKSSGKVVAQHKIETTGDPVILKTETDNSNWKADGMDLQHIRILAVDKKGRITPQARQELTFNIEGEAEIVGVVNGDINSNDMMTGNKRHLYNGLATVILRSTKTAGNAILTITGDDFKTIKLNLKTL